MNYKDQDLFDKVHGQICDNNCWNQVSGQYDPEECECPVCGARYTPKQEYFNSEASPEYDEDGNKLGSGEYQQIEFEGYIPDEMLTDEIIEQ